MSGASAPSPAGTIRVPRLWPSRQRVVDRLLCGVEERFAVAERHRSGDDRELEVEQVRDRGDRSTDEHPGPAPDGERRLGGGSPGHRRDGRARRLTFQTATGAGGIGRTVGFDDHVADVARVAISTVEQATLKHDAAADSGRHDHADEVRDSDGSFPPSLGERERLRVVVEVGGNAELVTESISQREVSPRGDVQRRHETLTISARAAATDAARGDLGPAPNLDR
ncbi:MAG: hypothetical protein OEU32_07360 [Acidimicrobiia bacterium]|nr:hypothetical protein [Acidimicrobiia bacterium]